LEQPPGVPKEAPGLHFKLKAAKLGSIQRGTNIYFKNIVIGQVQGFTLVDGVGVEIDAYIEPEYANLIRTSTRFWNSSGISFKGGLSGFKVRMESMASLIYGGISLYTPEERQGSPQATTGHVFTLYEDYDAAEYGIRMTLKISSAMGLSAGISKVMYRGFEAGTIAEFTFNPEDEQGNVTAHIILDPDAEFALREGTQFWIVEPQLSVNRLQHIDTIITGNYVTFNPGEGEFQSDFVAIEQPQEEEILRPGKKFKLVSENSQSFSIGAPVLFRKMQVGEVTSFDLSSDGKQIEANIFIYEKYANLIKPDSVFWKVGGIKIDASLDGISVETGTVTSLVAGGVSFKNIDNPDQKKDIQAAENTSFTLYESFHDATEAIPAIQPKGLSVHLKAESSKSFSAGSPILYKHIEVGEVTEVRLSENNQDIILDLFIAEKYAHLLQTTSRFYNVSGITMEGGISGLEVKTGSMKSILRGGIAFFTPNEGKNATENSYFTLYADYKSALDEDKIPIVLRFAEPEGLKKGVEIKFQGVTIGDVSQVKYGKNLESVIVEAFVDQGMERLFREDSLVWLVTAEVSISGVKHLDTLIKGPHIAILPGVGPLSFDIKALDTPPSMMEQLKDGLNIVLETPTLGSLKPDSPVYYRQVRVGRVMGSALSPTAQEVFVFVNIEEPYDALIHENTVFWNASGISVDAGIFSGVQIYTESIETILAGGIAFATPEGENMGGPAESGHHFLLHDQLNENWLSWRPEIHLEENK
jgi:paraquat-inducible protein B